jgi:NAD(P)-dependent dehydrogenase (short-subunit alcohol dehydrogenase family)
MQRILVTGSSRGIGLEFVRQYIDRGDRVFAACRDPNRAAELKELAADEPKRLTVLPMDVADAASIRAAHDALRLHADAIDVLINNAAVYDRRPTGAGQTDRGEQTLGELTFDDALAVLRTNAVAPLIVAQTFRESLRGGHNPRVVSITSGYGSVSGNTSGFPYHYSASKAALNQYMRSLAADLAKDQVTTIVMNPGWVRTDMGGPNATLTVDRSVSGMIAVVDELTPRDNNKFLDWQGVEQAW